MQENVAANFKHEFVNVPPLNRVTTDKGRYYQNKKGQKFFSVTTFLGMDEEKNKGLKKWRERVGEDEANGIMNSSSHRGESLHLICERYLLNQSNFLRDSSTVSKMMFNVLKPYLDNNINSLYGLELPLYSDYLKSAGTADVICVWNGKARIVDFKNSIRPKEERNIKSYFMQASAYCVMFEERTGIPVPEFSILIASQDGTGQMFEGRRDNYIHDYKKLVDKNYEKIYANVFGNSSPDG